MTNYKTLEERFEDKIRIDKETGCYLWTGFKMDSGYGRFRISGKLPWVMAHRWSYEHYVGPIPEGMKICHRCDNPPCVNPEHLFLGTQVDNMNDMVKKGRANSKLNKAQVIEIYHSPKDKRELAKEYGVSYTRVCAIKRKAVRNHILDPIRD